MKNKGSLIFTMVMTLIVVGAIAAMVIMKQNSNKTDAVLETKSVEPGKVTATDDYSKIDLKGQPMEGKKDAKITMVEFGDFKCPACKYFEENIKPKYVQKYIDKGDLKVYFIHTPFHGAESLLGGYAGESVLKHEPDKYWAFHEALFNLQPKQHDTSDQWLTASALDKAFDKAGIKDKEAIMKDVKASKEEMAVQKDVDLVQQYQITQTPTLIVDGKVIKDPMNEKQVTDAIEKALK